MTATRSFLFIWVLAVLGVCIYAVDNVIASTDTATSASSTFNRLKTLAGDWQAKLPDGKTASLNIRSVSGGSVLMITHSTPEGDMITMVHLDGANLMATHYCAAQNQPRFVAQLSTDPDIVQFKLKDITNLDSPEAGHMSAATFRFIDASHHNQEWTWSERGKVTKESFEFTRVK